MKASSWLKKLGEFKERERIESEQKWQIEETFTRQNLFLSTKRTCFGFTR